MIFSKGELILINEALNKAKNQSETVGFKDEKIILDSYGITSNENTNKLIQDMYNQLMQKIGEAMKNE
jgi:hypothetical protein